MGPKTLQLLDVLSELKDLLRDMDQIHWANWMQKSHRRLKDSDYSGIEYLLSAYGGMGSLNDIGWIDRPNEDERLEQLRAQAYELATEIKRDHEVLAR